MNWRVSFTFLPELQLLKQFDCQEIKDLKSTVSLSWPRLEIIVISPAHSRICLLEWFSRLCTLARKVLGMLIMGGGTYGGPEVFYFYFFKEVILKYF